MTPHSSRKERVCNACVMNNSNLEPTVGGGRDSDASSERSASVSELDLIEESVEIPVRRSRKWTMTEKDEEEEGTSRESSTLGSPPAVSVSPPAVSLSASTVSQSLSVSGQEDQTQGDYSSRHSC